MQHMRFDFLADDQPLLEELAPAARPERPWKVLLVEPDADTMELLVAAMVEELDMCLTCASSFDSAMEADLDDPHDLVISELDLMDGDGIALAGQLLGLRQRPFILLANHPTAEDAIEALRVGAFDLLAKPFPVSRVIRSAERALDGYAAHLEHVARHEKLRHLVKRVVRERRELQKRTELVCQDLVHAHRRLVTRVLDIEAENRASSKS